MLSESPRQAPSRLLTDDEFQQFTQVNVDNSDDEQMGDSELENKVWFIFRNSNLRFRIENKVRFRFTNLRFRIGKIRYNLNLELLFSSLQVLLDDSFLATVEGIKQGLADAFYRAQDYAATFERYKVMYLADTYVGNDMWLLD